MKYLTSLLLLTPALALPAPQEAGPTPSALPSDLPTCADEVQEFKGWDLTAFTLSSTSSTAAPLLGARRAVSTLSFKVENPILDYAVDCKAEATISGGGNETTSGAGQFDGQSEFSCEAPEDAVQDGEVVFSFDEDSGEVHLKQRWTCYDDPEYPTYYTGTGEGKAELECETGDSEVNKSWKVGSSDAFSSKKKECEETEVAIEVTQMEAIA